MRVVYNCHIREEIDNAILEAKRLNKPIQKIVITKDERREFIKSFNHFFERENMSIESYFYYDGVLIEVEEDNANLYI